MTIETALQLLLQALALLPTVAPEVMRLVEDFQKLFKDGKVPTAAEIDALIERVKTQSATIQAL